MAGPETADMKYSSRVEQSLGKLGEDLPVMVLAGPGQRGASDRPTEASVVQIGTGDPGKPRDHAGFPAL